MINARESLDLLLSSDKLDGLLAAARTKAASLDKKHQRPDLAKQASELDKHVEQVKELSGRAIKDLREALASKVAQRVEKVAIVRHLLHFGSKIQPV